MPKPEDEPETPKAGCKSCGKCTGGGCGAIAASLADEIALDAPQGSPAAPQHPRVIVAE